MSRGISSFSTASHYLSNDESRNDMNNAANDGTETDINSNSNTFAPNYQFSELSVTCQSLQDLQNRQLSLSATCQSISESPNGSILEQPNSIHTMNNSNIENTGSGNNTRTNRISFDFSSTSICHTIRELEPLEQTWL